MILNKYLGLNLEAEKNTTYLKFVHAMLNFSRSI